MQYLHPANLVVLVLAWVVLVAGIAWALPRLRGAAMPAADPAAVKWLLLAAVLAGAIFRFLLCPRLPMVNAYGGFAHVQDAYAFAALEWGGEDRSIYPQAVPVLAGATMWLTGKTLSVFSYVVSFASLMLVPAVYVLGRLLWGRAREALLAALFSALFPPLLTFSASAALTPAYATLATVSVAMLLLARQTGRWPEMCAGLAALILAVQTRPEAILFLLPAAAIFLWAPIADHDRPGLIGRWPAGRLAAAATVFLVLLAPHLALLWGHTAATKASYDAPGFAIMGTWLLRGSVVLAFFCWLGIQAGRGKPIPLGWAAALLALFFVLVLERSVGLHAFAGGALQYRGDLNAETYTPFAVVFFNPKLVPLVLILAYLTGFAVVGDSRERRIWLLLNCWLLVAFAAGVTKVGGELPYIGVRLALPAAPAFLLLAARGTTHAAQGVAASMLQSTWKRVLLTALIVLGLMDFVSPVHDAMDADFNQQAEFSTTTALMQAVPDNALVLFPAETVAVTDPGSGKMHQIDMATVFRTRHLLAALLADNPRAIELRRVSSTDVPLDLPADQPVFAYLGLDCFRTGTDATLPVCQALRAEYHLEAVEEGHIYNRIYLADFYHDLRIVPDDMLVGLYRVTPRSR